MMVRNLAQLLTPNFSSSATSTTRNLSSLVIPSTHSIHFSLMTAICIAPGGRIAMCHNCCICDSDLPAQISTAYDLDGMITEESGATLHERLVHQQIRLLLLHQRMVRQRSHLQLRRDQQDLSHAHVASLARKADRAMNLPRQGVAAGILLVAVFTLFIVLLMCRTLYLADRKSVV